MKHIFQKTSIYLLIFTLITATANAEHNWTEQIASFKPMVVNIETASEVVFETESKGTSFATGFVVDAERGIIATNRHVTGSSPAYIKINFHDGSFTEAKILYYDPTHDFGFYKIDSAEVDFELQSVTLGKWDKLSLGDELLLIGNNEKESIPSKLGGLQTSMSTKATDIQVTYTQHLTEQGVPAAVLYGIPLARSLLSMHAERIPPVLNYLSII